MSIDGTQKLYRDGFLQDPLWCERKVGAVDRQEKQQYVYVIEANITFKNGLCIPLMTEYLYRHNNQTENQRNPYQIKRHTESAGKVFTGRIML